MKYIYICDVDRPGDSHWHHFGTSFPDEPADLCYVVTPCNVIGIFNEVLL